MDYDDFFDYEYIALFTRSKRAKKFAAKHNAIVIRDGRYFHVCYRYWKVEILFSEQYHTPAHRPVSSYQYALEC